MRRLCDRVRHVAICGGRELRESRGVGRLTHNQLPPPPLRLASPPSRLHVHFHPHLHLRAPLRRRRPHHGQALRSRPDGAQRSGATRARRARLAGARCLVITPRGAPPPAGRCVCPTQRRAPPPRGAAPGEVRGGAPGRSGEEQHLGRSGAPGEVRAGACM